MRKLFFHTLLFAFLCGITMVPLLLKLSKRVNDRYYAKFTYGASSLVAGSSRALVSINPETIGQKETCTGPFLNFAFTQSISPYGEVYYNAIMKKLNGQKNGLFILEVSPLSVSAEDDEIPEKNMILGKLSFFNMNPNLDYILENAQHPIYLFFLQKSADKNKNGTVLHNSGWNEQVENPSPGKYRQMVEEERTAHRKLFKTSSLSDYRLHWLDKTINDLSAYGKVVLLRIPCDPEMEQMEQNYCPQFDSLMTAHANKYHVPYLDYFGTSGWEFYDLHHMTGASGTRFSAMLSDTLVKIAPCAPGKN